MATLEDEFKTYAEKVKGLKTQPSNSDLLKLYGLYKQATVGDNNTDRPGLLDPKGRGKWDSWNERKGMSIGEAMKQYVDFVKKLLTQ